MERERSNHRAVGNRDKPSCGRVGAGIARTGTDICTKGRRGLFLEAPLGFSIICGADGVSLEVGVIKKTSMENTTEFSR